MTRDEARAYGRQVLAERRAMLRDDWLFISDGNPYRMSAQQAARRLGVSQRTIVRWRTALRSQREPDAALSGPEWERERAMGDGF